MHCYIKHRSFYIDIVTCITQLVFSLMVIMYPPPPLQESQLNILRAPMPGVVKSILCVAGESVAEGANIVTLEAMKMQNPLFAPMSGIVRVLRETFF